MIEVESCPWLWLVNCRLSVLDEVICATVVFWVSSVECFLCCWVIFRPCMCVRVFVGLHCDQTSV